MSKEKYSFELRRGFNLEDHFTATFEEARQRGDRLASRLGRTRLYAYNDKLLQWEMLGTFLGHMRYLNKWGGQYIIMSDYSGLVMDSKAQEETK
jgi:hypothetical protein